jgi:hypothetical protein
MAALKIEFEITLYQRNMRVHEPAVEAEPLGDAST